MIGKKITERKKEPVQNLGVRGKGVDWQKNTRGEKKKISPEIKINPRMAQKEGKKNKENTRTQVQWMMMHICSKCIT
jgi:hypothetical protein